MVRTDLIAYFYLLYFGIRLIFGNVPTIQINNRARSSSI